MPKNRKGRRFLAVLVVVIVLVGAWLLIAKPLSNKKTEVAVGNPITEKTEKKTEESAKQDGTAGSNNGSTSSDGAQANLNMPNELTTTGASVNLALVGLLAGAIVYLLLLKLDLRFKN